MAIILERVSSTTTGQVSTLLQKVGSYDFERKEHYSMAYGMGESGESPIKIDPNMKHYPVIHDRVSKEVVPPYFLLSQPMPYLLGEQILQINFKVGSGVAMPLPRITPYYQEVMSDYVDENGYRKDAVRVFVDQKIHIITWGDLLTMDVSNPETMAAVMPPDIILQNIVKCHYQKRGSIYLYVDYEATNEVFNAVHGGYGLPIAGRVIFKRIADNIVKVTAGSRAGTYLRSPDGEWFHVIATSPLRLKSTKNDTGFSEILEDARIEVGG